MLTDTDARGVDWDLRCCLHFLPQPFAVDDIARVLAVVKGTRDGDPWWWLLELADGRPALLRGSQRVAGWSYWRSDAQSAIASAPYADWYCGAACDCFSAAYPDQLIPLDVIRELARQEAQGRQPTRREQVGAALAARGDAGEGER